MWIYKDATNRTSPPALKIAVVLSLAGFVHLSCAHAYPEFQSNDCKGRVHGVLARPDGESVAGIELELMPWGVDIDYVLPRTKTNDRGEYAFESLCPGKYLVFVEDEKAGYPLQYHELLLRLRGPVRQAVITATHTDAAFNVELPPLPAMLQIHAINSATGAEVQRVSARIRLKGRPRRSWAEPSADKDGIVVIPPDADLIVHVRSEGFHEWRESAGRGKQIRVPSGNRLELNVTFEPLQKR
jgi:hypothetical protein